MLPINHQFVLADKPEYFADTAAGRLDAIISAFGKRPCLISLSGGSTPFPVYKELARRLGRSDAGNRCWWMQTDERLVPANDPRSNQRGIKESLMSGGYLPQHSLVPVIVSKPPATENPAAFDRLCQDYHERLRQLPDPLQPPALIDLLILGIGTDGHTASLFPDTDWLTRSSLSGFAVFKTNSQPEPRFSLTLGRILQAREIVFLVNGEAKCQILNEIIFNPDCDIPAAHVARKRGVTWILDRAAAGRRLAGLIDEREAALKQKIT
ncbi:6-phosphogluconolactonase [Erysipelotrichia bacterium]